jgi:hypothetical protein
LALHFSKKLAFDLEKKTKAKSFQVVAQKSSKTQKQMLKIYIAYHSNQVFQYKYDLSLKKKEAAAPIIEKVFGELQSHKLPIRGVQVAENDGIIATHSFDCVKVWKVDFMA